MYVPGNTLLCDVAVLAQVLESVGAGRRIVLLVSEIRCLRGGFVAHAEAAIEDG